MNTLSGTSALLPCPFCGGKARQADGLNEHWISCMSCQASSIMRANVEPAISAWNMRIAPAANAGTVDVCRNGAGDCAAYHDHGIVCESCKLPPSGSAATPASEDGLAYGTYPHPVEHYERVARNLAAVWSNGNDGARTCILAALLNAAALAVPQAYSTSVKTNPVTQSERDILNEAIIPPAPEADAWDRKRTSVSRPLRAPE